jgi:glycosyltransferase involved in cell wall biosynthesis
MSELPLISVAICTYNGERFLRPQLDSVLAQEYPRHKVAVVNDVSQDGTFAILTSYAEWIVRMNGVIAIRRCQPLDRARIYSRRYQPGSDCTSSRR